MLHTSGMNPATTTPPNGPMTMAAKRAGTCIRCHEPIAVGDTIEYSRDWGARHPNCEEAPRPALTGDLRRVVEFLHAEGEKGPLPPFYESLARQFVLKGSLSPRQIAAVLRKLDEKSPELPGPDVVPAGRYAITLQIPNPKGEVTDEVVFVKVWRKPNIVRCYMLHGPNEDESPVNVKDVLEAIVKAGVGDAAVAYGRATGNCSQCDYGLRNRLSRHMCIGPVCGEKVHDHTVWLAKKAKARAELRAMGLDPNETLIESAVR